jgi:glycosyltransferase involved in cell wall biosynthesis
MEAPSRLRIAYVVDTFGEVKAGGVVSAGRWVAALRERHDVLVVTAGPAERGPYAVPGFQAGRLMDQWGFILALPRRRVLDAALACADVVHVQFPLWLGARAVALAHRAGVPVVAAHHVQPENIFLNLGVRSKTLCALTYRLFLRAVYQRADAVVCPSEAALAALRGRGLTTPAEVISNGIAPMFRPAAVSPAPVPGRQVLLLAVGRLAREKRHDVLVEGLRRSRHAGRLRLVVIGRGPDGARVRRIVRTLSPPGEVTFVADDELVRLLQSADLLIHASEFELEGMAVLEALGCGTPALIANAPGSAAPALAISPDFLFRAGDPDDLARHLDHLLDHPDRLAAARERCVELRASRTLDASVRRLEALYRRVMARSAAGGPRPPVQ